MINDDMLRNIEYLREKADVSYGEAAALLEQNGGNVMHALVELERRGLIFGQRAEGGNEQGGRRQGNGRQKAKDNASSFLKKAFAAQLVLEKQGENGEKTTVARIKAPLVAGAAIIAPFFTVAATAVALATGHSVKLREQPDNRPAQD